MSFSFFLVISGCSAGNNLNSNEEEESGTDDPLFSGGPVDLPVPIAKVEGLDPKNITVDITNDRLSITGRSGAVRNSTVNPQVWALNNDSGEITTVTSNEDGSFETITFDYDGSSLTIALAGFDGTNISTPIFLQVEENTYIWLLTNGSTISSGTLAMEENTAYLVIESTDRSTTSTLYSLEVGGVPYEIATGDITIDELFVSHGSILARSGNDLYFPNSDGVLESTLSIDSTRTINGMTAKSDNAGLMLAAISTDAAMHVCWWYELGLASTGDCFEAYTFASGESAPPFFEWVPFDELGSTLVVESYYLMVIDTTSQGTSSTMTASLYNSQGFLGSTLSGTLDGINYCVEQIVTQNDGSYILTAQALLQKQALGDDFNLLEPKSSTSSCNASTLTSSGEDGLSATMVLSSTSKSYLLDTEVTLGPDGSLCSASLTRTIYDVEMHPSGELVFFCADDDAGQGQIYVMSLDNLNSGSSTNLASEDDIIQLTCGAEHCNEQKNWKVDIEADGSVVIVDNTNPNTPQIQFIDPEDPQQMIDCRDN